MTKPNPSTEQSPERQIPLDRILGRYQQELAEKTQALFVAQATAEHAEAECAALRLRVVELEAQPTAG